MFSDYLFQEVFLISSRASGSGMEPVQYWLHHNIHVLQPMCGHLVGGLWTAEQFQRRRGRSLDELEPLRNKNASLECLLKKWFTFISNRSNKIMVIEKNFTKAYYSVAVTWTGMKLLEHSDFLTKFSMATSKYWPGTLYRMIRIDFKSIRVSMLLSGFISYWTLDA